jgi:hypothetical protein
MVMNSEGVQMVIMVSNMEHYLKGLQKTMADAHLKGPQRGQMWLIGAPILHLGVFQIQCKSPQQARET